MKLKCFAGFFRLEFIFHIFTPDSICAAPDSICAAPDSILNFRTVFKCFRTVFFICGQYSLLTGKNLTKSKKNTAIPQNINGKRKLTTEYLYLSRLNHQMQGPFQQTQRLVNEILQRISAHRFIAIHHAVESGLFFCDRITGEK